MTGTKQKELLYLRQVKVRGKMRCNTKTALADGLSDADMKS